MTIQARLETFEDANRRASPRRRLRLGSTLTGAGHEVVIHDLSSTGVLLQTSAELGAFDNFEIELPEVGATHAYVVWTSSDFFGCEFAKPIPRAALSAAQLRNPIAQPMAEPAAEAWLRRSARETTLLRGQDAHHSWCVDPALGGDPLGDRRALKGRAPAVRPALPLVLNCRN